MITHPLPKEDPILEWRAPQHLHHKRTRFWYVIAAAFIAICIGYSIFTSAWTFTFLIVVVTCAYWKVHNQEPLIRRMRVWKRGYAIDDTYTDWGECTGYWILRMDEYCVLHIEKSNGVVTHIQTGEVDPYLLHDVLSPIIANIPDRHERPLDTIIRICKL